MHARNTVYMLTYTKTVNDNGAKLLYQRDIDIYFEHILFFSGICLNSVVILSLWRSPQLRKKLCYFMIMVLSCCDLLAVLTNHPLMACITVSWMSGKVEVYPSWLRISIHLANIFIGLSLVALLVMNFDRYLATSYPIYHRTSVTKRRLLTLVAILNIVNITLEVIFANDLVISYEVGALIFYIILCPPILFINYKLITIARKSRRNNGISPEIKKSISWKNISSCLLAVACFVVLSIPTFVYIGFGITSKDASILEKSNIAALWVSTIISMNSTFNCLIFYWKNKILRTRE